MSKPNLLRRSLPAILRRKPLVIPENPEGGSGRDVAPLVRKKRSLERDLRSTEVDALEPRRSRRAGGTEDGHKFAYHYKVKEVPIGDDGLASADILSKIKGIARGLPPIDELIEAEAYQDWTCATLQVLIFPLSLLILHFTFVAHVTFLLF